MRGGREWLRLRGINGGRTQPQVTRHDHYPSVWPGGATTDAASALSLLKLDPKHRPQLVAATGGGG
jgi:hypothetical protein